MLFIQLDNDTELQIDIPEGVNVVGFFIGEEEEEIEAAPGTH